MNDKNKKDDDIYFYSKVETDEMQRTLSFELEHKSFRMWYIFNSVIMLIVHFIFLFDDIDIRASSIANESVKSPKMIPAMQVIILLFYGAGLLSLALYNYRAASKGVLDAFASKYQKGAREDGKLVGGEKNPDNKGRILALINLMLPAHGLGTTYRSYMVFYLVWLILAFAYEVFTIFCMKKNKKVRESLAADDEDIEEE